MNKVILMGRLTKDVDYRETTDGMKVSRYTLAVDRPKKKDGSDGGADFIGCVAFGKGAEFASKYFTKGMKVLVTGKWQSGSYEKDGKTVYTNECFVNEQEFCESKKATEAPKEKEQSGSEGFMNIPDGVEDEGLPFN